MTLRTDPLEFLFPEGRMYRNKSSRRFKTTCRGFEESGVIVFRNVYLNQDVFLGEACYLRENASIESGVFLGPEVYVGEGVGLGQNCHVAPHVKIHAETWLDGGPWIWLACPPAVQINTWLELRLYSPHKLYIGTDEIPFDQAAEYWDRNFRKHLTIRENRLGQAAVRFFRQWVKNNIRFLTKKEEEKIQQWKKKAKTLK